MLTSEADGRITLDYSVFVMCEVRNTTVCSHPAVQSQNGAQYSVKLLIEMHHGKRPDTLNTQILADFELLNLPFRTAGLGV
jgi:hypothetical protein